MDIKGKKEKIIKFIEKADSSVIEKIERLINLEISVSASDIYNKVKLDIMGNPMNTEDYNRDVEAAINELEKGNSIAHDEVVRKMKKW